ncbi:MAG: NUDIX hydrolase [Tissierellia bacterium]|nr:NUDIX hydrolase [Tissierellia bacterium]
MIQEEVTIKSEKIYEGKILNLKVDTVELPDKKYTKREIVEHSGGVGVVAITKKDNIILVNQYRQAISKEILEIPAGKLEIGEEPRSTALRELQEETGYSAQKLRYITEFYPTPGYCTEKIHLFVADDLVLGEQNLDEHEYVEVVEIPFDEAYEKVLNGDIVDAKTIIAILLIKNERSKNE